MIERYEQNPLWAGNLLGQSYDDFTFLWPLNEDSDTVRVAIIVSGLETGYDEATVPITITVESLEDAAKYDAATVLVDIQPTGVDTAQYVDATTVPITVSIDSHDCHTFFAPNLSSAFYRAYEATTPFRLRGIVPQTRALTGVGYRAYFSMSNQRFIATVGDAEEVC